MRCVFCKTNSDDSKSVEHIVPESFGNTEHTLPKGWVCDGCNNYFSREVEKPFLESVHGRGSRFEMAVPSKKGRIPSVFGLHPASRTKIEIAHSEEDGSICIGAAEGEDESQLISSLLSNVQSRIYVPVTVMPQPDRTTARFIGKIAVEALVERCVDVPGWNDEIVDKVELDALREYVRRGQPNTVWPVNIRRIYAADSGFSDGTHGIGEVLHEWTILYTPKSELYAIVAIFGIEYSVNLGGPEIDGYIDWLCENDNRSPLYPDRKIA